MRESKEQRQISINIALDYKLEGMSYRAIAKKMGVHRCTAHSYVTEAIKIIQEEYTEKAEALVTLEREKLDLLEVGLIKATRDGDVKAATAMLKIMERRAKLLGLDKATEIKVETVTVDIKAPEGL